MPNTDPLLIAAGQLDTPGDPTAAAAPHRAGRDLRQLMSRAHEQGARLIHFCEGAISCAAEAHVAPAGIIGLDGAWSARCPATGTAAVAIAGIDREHDHLARPWRRIARGGRYVAAAAIEDPRTSRDSF